MVKILNVRIAHPRKRIYEAIVEDASGSMIISSDYFPTAKEALNALQARILDELRYSSDHEYVFVEHPRYGVVVFHLYFDRGGWVYTIVRPGMSPCPNTIFAKDTTLEQARHSMMIHAQQYGKVLGSSPNFLMSLLKKEEQTVATV